LFAGLFSPTIAGVFLLAHRAFQLPLSLVGNGVSQVFYAKIAETQNKNCIGELVVTTFCRLLMISIVPYVIIIFIAPDIFLFLFGDGWRGAGIYVQYMGPWLLLQFCVSSISRVAIVMEKQKGLLVSQVIFLVARVGVILGGSYIGMGDEEIILYFASISALLYLGHFVWICAFLGVGFRPFLMAVSHNLRSCSMLLKNLF